MCYFLRLFYARHHPTICCSLVRHPTDSQERDRKSRQRRPLLPSPPLSRFPLSLNSGCAPAHGWLPPHSVKRAANGRVTDIQCRRVQFRSHGMKSADLIPTLIHRHFPWPCLSGRCKHWSEGIVRRDNDTLKITPRPQLDQVPDRSSDNPCHHATVLNRFTGALQHVLDW